MKFKHLFIYLTILCLCGPVNARGTTNEFARRAEIFNGKCSKVRLPETRCWKDLTFLMKSLPHLSLPEGYELIGLMPDKQALGDQCYLYAHSAGTELPLDFEKGLLPEGLFSLEQVVICDGSAEGVWEMFLLLDAWRFLPMVWHACYARVKYVLDADGLWETTGLENEKRQEFDEFSILAENGMKRCEYQPYRRYGFRSNDDIRNMNTLVGEELLLPNVKVFSDGSAKIYYSYWSAWEGLVCSSIDVRLDKGKATLGKPRCVILANYNCGIMF